MVFLMAMMTNSARATNKISDFHSIWPWSYKSDGLYEVDIGINSGTDSANATLSDGSLVVAIGDLDDDKHNDIITMTDNQSSFTVHFYDEKNMDYSNSLKVDSGSCKIAAVFIIPNPDYRLALLCTENSG